jgi:hypothetical protein
LRRISLDSLVKSFILALKTMSIEFKEALDLETLGIWRHLTIYFHRFQTYGGRNFNHVSGFWKPGEQPQFPLKHHFDIALLRQIVDRSTVITNRLFRVLLYLTSRLSVIATLLGLYGRYESSINNGDWGTDSLIYICNKFDNLNALLSYHPAIEANPAHDIGRHTIVTMYFQFSKICSTFARTAFPQMQSQVIYFPHDVPGTF